jgi:subtilisin family serine protease
MRTTVRSLFVAVLGIAAVTTALAATGRPGVPRPGRPSVAGAPAPSVWLVELEEPASGLAWAEVLEESGPVQAPPRGLVARARAAAESRLVSITAAQDALAPALARLGGSELYRVRRALNGIAVVATAQQAVAFRRLEGVKAVRPIEPAVPHNRTSVPFLGAPAVWGSAAPLVGGATGRGVRIGIIDTGVDYLHGDFGGTGLLADYQQAAADTTGWTTRPSSGPGRFPTAKIAGGWDFAGDAYNGGNAPAPDPNPMDCNGHGTHVAGTAAGFGVTAAGATYAGPYNATDPYSTAPRIGPGVAPEATLYALRVFGCGGSSALVPEAIDWAIDPDGDGDFSDRLDVINMSLGSSFGHADEVTAEAADNAARAGVVVVASAGNSGDTYFVQGSPAAAGRAISVAGSLDDGKGALLRANAPASLAGDIAAGAAFFGPSLVDGSVTGDVALANDGTGTVTDACEPLVGFPPGAVALVHVVSPDCSVKAKTVNAQAAGAIAAIVAWPGTTPPPLGDNPTITTPVTIPTISVTAATAATIEAALASGTVNVTLIAAGDSLYLLSSRGPRAGVPIRLKPDVAAPAYVITSARNGRGSGAYSPDNASTMMSGTSMAAPHVAGVMALLRQAHPDWTVEQLKALLITHAAHDVTQFSGGLGPRYGMGRVGAGRVDASAATDDLVAFGLDERGLVSVSFEGEVQGAVQSTRRVMVVNHGGTAVTLGLGLASGVEAPGVSFSIVGPPTVTLPAGGSTIVDVSMAADAAHMTFSADPTVATVQGYPSSPRFRLSEAAAFLTFSTTSGDPGRQTLGPRMRLPLYAALRPASATEASGPIQTGGAATGTGSIALAGTGLCTGTVVSGTCAGTFPTDHASLVSAFELQGVSGKDPTLAGTTDASADLRYAGVQYDAANGLLVFAIATWESWATPSEASFTIVVDGNADGTDDRVLMNPLFWAGGNPTDIFAGATGNYVAGATLTFNQYVNLLAPDVIDTGLWGTNVLTMAATPAAVGVTVGQPFRWRVASCPGWAPSCALPPVPAPLDSMGPFTWNTAAQGLDFGGRWAVQDQPGNAIPVSWNTADFAVNGTQGALLVHHHNREGARAEPVLVQADAVVPPPSADLAVALVSPAAVIQRSTTATVSVTVTNAGPSAASGLAVHVPLPRGLAYLSHSGPGTYDPAIGIWTVGSLNPSATDALGLTFEGRDPGRYTLLAEVATASPPDPRLLDDRATAALTVAEDGETAPGGYFTVSPCRAIDTRNESGPWGGPPLGARAQRVFPMVGRCGIPVGAKAVAVNMTVTAPTGSGYLRAYAASLPSPPPTSALNFAAGATRANNAVVALSPAGELAVYNGMSAGTAQLVVDVVGYFE